jgi:transposase
MTLAVMEEILVAGERSEQSNDRRSTALTEEIELRVRRERHRRWRPDEKLRIVQETLRPGAVIADVARRHGIGSGLLYTWRKEMLATTMAGLVPVEVQAEAPLEAPAPPPGGLRSSSPMVFGCVSMAPLTRWYCGACCLR